LGAAGVAQAALRVPQVAVQGPGLQAFLNQQLERSTSSPRIRCAALGHLLSNNPTFTMQLELTRSSPGGEIGIYNGASAAPALYRLFPASATDGWFLIARSGTSPVRVVVSVFDAAVTPISSTTYLGADRFDFGSHPQGPGGTFYSQDIRNAEHDARVLSFAGTGSNSGSFWMAFENGSGPAPDDDFFDAVIYLEPGPQPITTSPVAVLHSNWGSLKARFR
jgi:hypothetical protein